MRAPLRTAFEAGAIFCGSNSSCLTWWLTYRKPRRLVGIAIAKSPALTHARLMTAVCEIDAAAPSADGHELGADLVASRKGTFTKSDGINSCSGQFELFLQSH